jgi:hypothetical protein
MVPELQGLGAEHTTAEDIIAVHNLVQPGHLKQLEATRGSLSATHVVEAWNYIIWV